MNPAFNGSQSKYLVYMISPEKQLINFVIIVKTINIIRHLKHEKVVKYKTILSLVLQNTFGHPLVMVLLEIFEHRQGLFR